MVWQGKRRKQPRIKMRLDICSWCQTKYLYPAAGQRQTYFTADGPPPSRVGVYVDGAVVHECNDGIPTIYLDLTLSRRQRRKRAKRVDIVT